MARALMAAIPELVEFAAIEGYYSPLLIGMAVAEFFTWVIPPMPLYDEFYKTADHEGAIFLHASMSVMIISFVIL